MDISKFRDIIQRVNVFKVYSSLLVPVVVGLVAVVFLILASLMGGKLKRDMAKGSIAVGREVRSLSESAVADEQWRVEQEYQRAVENDANRIAVLARQSAQRRLLSYKIFPEPKDTSTLIFEEFGRQYRDAIDGLIARVNARDCPTDAELERHLRSSISSPRSRRTVRRSYSALSEVDAEIRDAVCRAKAESASVYANPADLSGYGFWEGYEYDVGMKKSIEDCWYWQLGYWIIEDVIDTIGTLNSGSDGVLTSPVKRLLAVSFAAGEQRFGGTSRFSRSRRSRARAAEDRPRYVLSIEDGLAESCTGRFSDEDIDVVHFEMSVVVGAKAVLPFMQQLCSAKEHKFSGWDGKGQEQIFRRNQITVLESRIASIDREDETHNLYRYGEDAVVQLDLICEYIFDRNGCDEIKPESVRESQRKPEE